MTATPAALVRALDEKATKGPRVLFATVRTALADDGHDEDHIECRFDNGEKFAPIVVDADRDDLAFWVAASFTLRNALPTLAALLEAAEALRDSDGAGYVEVRATVVAYDDARAAFVAQMGAKP